MNFRPMEWNEGEAQMHKLLQVPDQYNPTSPGLSPHAQRLLHLSSLFALGVVDDEGRPWTTLFGGEQGFARSIDHSIIGMAALSNVRYDPVVQTILDGSIGDPRTARDFSALGVHLASRDRVKLQGKVLGAGVTDSAEDDNPDQPAFGEVQLALAILGSLGNCPKYLNKKEIVLTPPNPVLLSNSLPLCETSLDLIAQADLIFITSHQPSHMSTNERGGPPGFVRVEKNDASGCILVYPEYSGNRLYQTLGNLYLDPRAGVCIPDFNTGNILYLTCTAKILFGSDAASTLPRSNLALQLLVISARLVERGLGFRGIAGEPSPYNPPVRYLGHERLSSTDAQAQSSGKAAYAKLLSRTKLTPTIARFKFSISDPKAAGIWKPGQYVALAFEDELSGGYAHMNDSDPKSLNDDYIRTFTVSSPPHASGCGGDVQQDEFEVTVRNVGKVTDFLFKVNSRVGLELPLKGFSGTFSVDQKADGTIVPFIAGGIGITPLLSQLQTLDLEKLRLFWTVNAKDIGLVVDVFRKHPRLATSTTVYVSGADDNLNKTIKSDIGEIKSTNATVIGRRITKEDVTRQDGLSSTWYLCTGGPLRKLLLEWLKDKTTIYEDFDY